MKKEKIKSVILTNDRGFKRTTIQLLIEAAFPAEKFVVETAKDAGLKFKMDREVENVIIDGRVFEGPALVQCIKELLPYLKNRENKLLIYIDPETQNELIPVLKQALPRASFPLFPLRRVDFIESFYPLKKKAAKSPNLTEKEKESGKSKEDPEKLSFFETSLHVKVTIEMFNDIAKSKTDLEAVRNIGQRFNGIFGAFAFYGDKAGYKQLKELSIMIDNVCRTYEEQFGRTEISDKHLKILMDSAKCSYKFLQLLRDGKELPKDIFDYYDKTKAEYDGTDDIERKTRHSQSEIDDLIEAELNKGAS